MSGITDLGTTLAWLDAAPQVHRSALVVRFALRVLPGIALEQYALDEVALPVFRAALTSVVATAFPTPPVMGAAAVASSAHANVQKSFQRNASPQYYSEASRANDKDVVDPTETGADAAAAVLLAARMASGTASDAIASVSSAAGFFRGDDNAGAAQAAYAAASKDAEYLERSGSVSSLLQQPLWHDEQMPEALQEALKRLERVWYDDPKLWNFWERWYRGMLEGKQLDRDVQQAVTLIEDEIWERERRNIAKKIGEIEAEFTVERIPQAEIVFFDFETGVFDAAETEEIDDLLLNRIFSQIDFALRTALSSNCGLNSSSVAHSYIEYTLKFCRKDPNSVEQNLEISARDISTGLLKGDYFEDTRLVALLTVLERAVIDLRANHPMVAEAWKKRSNFVLKSLKAEQKRSLVQSTLAVTPVFSEKVSVGVLLDAKTAANSEDGPVRDVAFKRWVNRFAQTRLISRSADVIRRIQDNPAYIGADIIQKLEFIWNLISGLW